MLETAIPTLIFHHITQQISKKRFKQLSSNLVRAIIFNLSHLKHPTLRMSKCQTFACHFLRHQTCQSLKKQLPRQRGHISVVRVVCKVSRIKKTPYYLRSPSFATVAL